MEKVFTEIFESVLGDLEKNLEAYKKGALASDPTKPVGVQGKGKIPVPFHLDNNGYYHYEASQYGAGATVHCTAQIDFPDGTYTVTVRSSDGGGGHWENLKAKSPVKFDIHTSFWHSTTLTVDIWGPKNVDGQATIEYSY
jgi:hypothetical protein